MFTEADADRRALLAFALCFSFFFVFFGRGRRAGFESGKFFPAGEYRVGELACFPDDCPCESLWPLTALPYCERGVAREGLAPEPVGVVLGEVCVAVGEEFGETWWGD